MTLEENQGKITRKNFPRLEFKLKKQHKRLTDKGLRNYLEEAPWLHFVFPNVKIIACL